MSAYIFLLVLLALLWLLLIRPRRRQLRQQQRQISSLEVGDEILTAGGIYGTVTGIGDDEVRVRIAPELEVRVALRAVATVLTERPGPGELEATEEPEEEQEGG